MVTGITSQCHFSDSIVLKRILKVLGCRETMHEGKGKGSTYSNNESTVPELILVFGSQPAGDASHKPGGRLPLLSVRTAVTLAILNRAATNFAAC